MAKKKQYLFIHLSFQISTISLDNFSGPNGRVQVEKQGGGWKEGKKEERDFNQCQCNVSQFTSFEYKLNQDVRNGPELTGSLRRRAPFGVPPAPAPPLSAPSLSAPLPSPSPSLPPPPLQPPRGGCDAMAAIVAVPTQHIRCAITLRKELSIYCDKASSAKIYILC